MLGYCLNEFITYVISPNLPHACYKEIEENSFETGCSIKID